MIHLNRTRDKGWLVAAVMIGVDPPVRSHTAVAIDGSAASFSTQVASAALARVPNDTRTFLLPRMPGAVITKLGRGAAGRYGTRSLSQSSAVWATSRQP